MVLSIAVDAGPAVAGACGARTESVLVQRAGGLAGTVERFVVNRAGADAAGAKVLALTAGQRFRQLQASYLPADLCCDRFVYTVVARYADGSSKTVTTTDATPFTPPPLLVIIRLMTEKEPIAT
ncbi:hypothetical protein AB0G04_26655 [Actinoplanes sp. NPDC023801]|uniref:hypothetical protein n=1 Tax=Actinoplanes sp. NPDC023801 TaxID=3154595 RepID=UPI0033D7639E